MHHWEELRHLTVAEGEVPGGVLPLLKQVGGVRHVRLHLDQAACDQAKIPLGNRLQVLRRLEGQPVNYQFFSLWPLAP